MQDLTIENVGQIEKHWDKFVDSVVAQGFRGLYLSLTYLTQNSIRRKIK